MTDKKTDSVTPVTTDGETAAAQLEGRCVQKTHRTMASDGSLPEEAIAAVREQASRLIQKVVRVYELEVARGEVGVGGAARVLKKSSATRGGVSGTTGLLYGRIQSGKTAGMISFVSHAIDNGFRTIIVLTSDNVALVDQTASRFYTVNGTKILSSTTADRWEEETKSISKNLPGRGLIVVCSTNVSKSETQREFLRQVGASEFPTLILDDEADQASLDANTRRRARVDEPSLLEATRVSDEIQKIRNLAANNVFVQVTATPFAMFLQNVDSPFRPGFTFLLEPGKGYTGGERFFSEEILDLEKDHPEEPPLCLIDDDEPERLREATAAPPPGLRRALAFFLVSASARGVTDESKYAKGQNFLCHESHKKADHKDVARLIRHFLDETQDKLQDKEQSTLALFQWAYEELKKTADPVPPLADILEDVEDRLPMREVIVVNSEGDSLDPKPRVPNFIVGGNIVGRGLTIPNLLVTYYGRNPKVSQMDTMLQHARMFGYRAALMPYTRVFLPPSLAARFQGIYIAERELRESLQNDPEGRGATVSVLGELRATRYGVLDPREVTMVRAGQHLYPVDAPVNLSKKSKGSIEKILRQAGIREGWQHGKPQAVRLDADAFQRLLEAFGIDDWTPAVFRKVAESLGDHVELRVRGMARKRAKLPTGAVSGDERSEARANPAGVVTMFVFRQNKPTADGVENEFYYPTVIFPARMANQVYNRDGQLEAN